MATGVSHFLSFHRGAFIVVLVAWPVTREYWDALDAAAFYWLHGSILDGGNDWRVLWAYANFIRDPSIASLLSCSRVYSLRGYGAVVGRQRLNELPKGFSCLV